MRTLIGVLLICSCSDSGLNGNDISQDVACADFVKALCGQLQTCGAPLVITAYGDQATCELRLKPSCLSTLKDPGTTLTTNRLDACAKKYMALTCTAAFNHTIPDECRATPGTLADGTPCGDDDQCKSAYCKKAANSTCGVCGAKGGACNADGDCESGFICANMACVQRATMGAACSANQPCAYGLVCDAAVCKTPPGLGMTCTPDTTGGNCDKTQGNLCNPISNVCQAVMYAKPGSPCAISNMNYYLCSGGGHCTGQVTGNCMAPAADGAACDDTNGPTCLSPAKCLNKVCTLPDTSTCK